MSKYKDKIVAFLSENKFLGKLVLYIKERENLQQKVNVVCKDNIDDENKISQIMELVMEDGLQSMLQFVYALIIVDEKVRYETKLLMTEAETK